MSNNLSIQIFILLLTFSFAASADRGLVAHGSAGQTRTALVIGNRDYKTSPLNNPANDATDMAAALHESGFDVTIYPIWLVRFPK